MAIGVTLLIIGILIAAIWIILEFKRMRHKMFAIFLIVLILFTYFSFTHIVKQNNVKLDTASGIFAATKLYFSWLGSLFGNVKSITANAIKMDWAGGNETKK
jgi:formate/nitrite transporter FocA (FNT family)